MANDEETKNEKTIPDAVMDVGRRAMEVGASGKPGYRTTEFWVTTALFLFGTGISIYGASKGNDTLVTVGGGMASLSGFGYSVSRGMAKRDQPLSVTALPR